MRKILTLGVGAMALAALVAMGTGCTGDDDDDDAGGPGGVMVVAITSGGGISADYSYAEFYSDYVGTFTSLRDIPIDSCVDYASLGTDTSSTITYLDAGATATATGPATATYNRDTTGGEITYALGADVPAGTPGDYDLATETFGALATVTVPSYPGPVVGGADSVSWTTAGADDAFVAVAAMDFSVLALCHTSDDGLFNIPTSLGLTSGLVGVAVANYGEADLEGRSVVVAGQAGDPADFTLWN